MKCVERISSVSHLHPSEGCSLTEPVRPACPNSKKSPGQGQNPSADDRASYDATHFAPLFESEDRHFWFQARNRCIAAATRLIPNRGSVRDVIEHGCGTGFVLRELQRQFPQAGVVGADLFPEGLAMARRRFNGPLLQLDLLQSEFREAFDLVGLFDVLEHLDDDLRVLRVLRQQVRPGGYLLLTVPAHMALWSDYDVASGHRRRYARRELIARLSEANFQVEFCTEFMFGLLLIMWLRRRVSWRRKGQRLPATDQIRKELNVHPALNRLMALVLYPEPWWIAHGRCLPSGTSLIALARRTQS